MPDQFYNFQVTTPAGTAASAPLTTATTMPVRIVRHIQVKVPPGPSGHLRFQICVNGVSVIPVNGAVWIETDNRTLDFPMTETIESGAWQVKSYNTGIYAHTIEVLYMVDLPKQKNGAGIVAPLSI